MPKLKPINAPLGVGGVPRLPVIDTSGGVGRAVQQAGAALGQTAGLIAKQRAEDIRDWSIQTMAKTREEWTRQMVDLRSTTSLDAPDVTPDTLAAFDSYAAQQVESAPSKEAQSYLTRQFAEFRATLAGQLVSFDAERRAGRRVQTVVSTIDSGRNTLLNDPTQFSDIWASTRDFINTLAIPGDDKAKLLMEAEDGLALSAVQGTIHLAPKLALEQLTSGHWDEHIDPDKKEQMTRAAQTAIDALEVDAANARKRAKDALKEAQQATADVFLERLYRPGNDPLTVDEILQSNLNPTGEMSQKTFIDLLRQEASGEEINRTNAYVYNDLFEQVQTDQITDEAELLAHVGRGISPADYQRLQKEIDRRKDPAEKATSEAEKAFFDQAKSQITRSTMFERDPRGDELYYFFQQAYWKAKANWVAAGRDPAELLNPSSSSYFGDPGHLGPYLRTPTDRLNDMSREMRGQNEPGRQPAQAKPRQPGETAEQYLKRIGAVK